TSLRDYQKWTQALWDGRLLSIEDAFKNLNYPIKKETGSAYGPGWFYFEAGEPAYFHSGSTCGFSTFVINMPESKTSIVYFSNIAGKSRPFQDMLKVLHNYGFSEADK